MKIHFLGTCSGTEPVKGSRHLAFAIEKDKKLYWFDAGETSSYTAHVMGLDLLSVEAIFISHSHMDHVGGLGNLLWNIRKINNVEKKGRMKDRLLEVFMADELAFLSILALLGQTEGNFKIDWQIKRRDIKKGLIFQDKDFLVYAKGNSHMGIPSDEKYLSHSFRIKGDGKSIVFSGDLGDLSDIQEFIDEPCDLLLMETGHFTPSEVAEYISKKGDFVKSLCFIHNGRLILENPKRELKKVRKIIWQKVFIAKEASSLEIP